MLYRPFKRNNTPRTDNIKALHVSRCSRQPVSALLTYLHTYLLTYLNSCRAHNLNIRSSSDKKRITYLLIDLEAARHLYLVLIAVQ